jgi:hypothetical protein
MSADANDLRAQALQAKKYLVDPYQDWIDAEGVPVARGAALDLSAVALAPWARYGVRGAACNVDGRCDFLTCFVFELDAGQSSAPVRKIYEESVYVLAGAGVTRCTMSDGRSVEISWRAGDAFAPPINATCVHKATQGPARIASFNDLRYLMGLYRNEAFIFANSAPFAQRQAQALAAGLSASARDMALTPGDGHARASLALAANSIALDVTELPAKGATLAARQMQGAHLLCLSGAGFSIAFDDETSPLRRVDWRPGTVVGLGGMSFRQHFNAGSSPARFAKIEYGSQSTPIFRSRRAAYGDTQVYASGSAVIERAQERADVAALRS